MSDDQNALLSTEVDAFVEALEPFEVEDIGKPRYETVFHLNFTINKLCFSFKMAHTT